MIKESNFTSSGNFDENCQWSILLATSQAVACFSVNIFFLAIG
jgi:hypothetical protein